MPDTFDMRVVKDEISPAVRDLKGLMRKEQIQRTVGRAVVLAVQDHLNGLGANKKGWPSTGFYAGAARATTWDFAQDGVIISIDNPDHPGAMRQRYHGGPIDAKDKLLTIPASAAFYGQRATDFTNLRFVVFGNTGLMALVVGQGGAGKVDFATGQERSAKGAGKRAEGMVAFWLKDHVDQAPDPDVLPTGEELGNVAAEAVAEAVERMVKR